MQRVASLQGAKLNLSALREDSRNEFINLLEESEGRKCLVLDKALGGIMNQVIPDGPKFLKDQGVAYFKELSNEFTSTFKDKNGNTNFPDNVIYIVRPSLPLMKIIASNIKEGKNDGFPSDFMYKIYFVPAQTLLCQKLLQDEGVLPQTYLYDYPLDLIPLDTDLISLEMEDMGALLGGHSGPIWASDGGSAITTVANSLVKLQAIYGTVPNVKSFGTNSAAALKLSMRKRKEDFNSNDPAMRSANASPEIDTLVLLDRSVDIVSPLITPLTYEGLIDEFINISNGFIKVDAEILGEEVVEKGPRMIAVPLNSSDSLYSAIRNLSVEQLGPYLQEKAKGIRESYSNFRGNKDQSILEIHEFVKRIPGLNQMFKSLNQHIRLAEIVKGKTDGPGFRKKWQAERSMLEGESGLETIETLIYERAPFWDVMKLLCLQSVTKGGISNKYDSIRKDIVQTYGFPAMHSLIALESLGLLKKGGNWIVDSGAVGSWSSLKKSLRLLSDITLDSDQTDVSYVCAGFAPISARLIQVIGGGGGGDLGTAVRSLLGPFLDFKQGEVPVDLKEAYANAQNSNRSNATRTTFPSIGSILPGQNVENKNVRKSKKVMVAYFLGGVTFMEIAALRFLSSQQDFGYDIVIATTKLVNGKSFLKGLCPVLKKENS